PATAPAGYTPSHVRATRTAASHVRATHRSGRPPRTKGLDTAPGRTTARETRRRWPASRIAGITAVIVLATAITYPLWRNLFSRSSAPACGYKIAFLGSLKDVQGAAVRDSVRLAVDQYNAKHGNCASQLVEYDTSGQIGSNLASSRARQILS